MFDLLTTPEWLGAIAITLLAGVIKGAVGFAMPLIMIALMGLYLPPTVVVAGIILPILLSNAAQIARFASAEIRAAIKEFRVYLALVCGAILISSQALTSLPVAAVFLIIGAPVAMLCLVQLAGVRLVLPERYRAAAAWVAGLVSGTIGGLAGTWGPPTILYFLAIETPKAKQVLVGGIIYFSGSVMLLIGHSASGVLNRETLPLSVVLIAPAVLGMWIGFKIHDRIDQETFRKATLVVLLLAALNLIRKGLMG